MATLEEPLILEDFSNSQGRRIFLGWYPFSIGFRFFRIFLGFFPLDWNLPSWVPFGLDWPSFESYSSQGLTYSFISPLQGFKAGTGTFYGIFWAFLGNTLFEPFFTGAFFGV